MPPPWYIRKWKKSNIDIFKHTLMNQLFSIARKCSTIDIPSKVWQILPSGKAFDKDLLSLMKDWQYKVISVCLDKKKHKETYSVWRFDPYHYCLAVLLERFVFFLKRKDACGDAMAESRGGKEDRRLKDSFRTALAKWNGLCRAGSVSGMLYKPSVESKNKSK